MTFDELINETILCKPFNFFKPKGTERAISFFKEMKEEAKKSDSIIVCGVGDWDVDGILSLKLVKDTTDFLDVPMEVYFGTEKVHGLTNEFVNLALEKKYKYIIVTDSSTNEMEKLRHLSSLGFKVLIIDHHIPSYDYGDYPQNIVIINAKMKGNELIQNVSAGMLCYLICSFVRKYFGGVLRNSDILYGYITLISDSCDLSDKFIVPIILGIVSIKDIPREVQLFTDKYTIINKDFFVYKFNNILNNVCRMERIDLIEKVFFEDNGIVEKAEAVEEMKNIHNFCRDEMIDLAEHVEPYLEDLGSCYFCDMGEMVHLTRLPKNYLINSTGLLANKISPKYGKASIVAMEYTPDIFKFSGRDVTSRFPFQDMMKVLDLDGGGHIAAAGFQCPKIDLQRIKDYCRKYEVAETKVVKDYIMDVKLNSEFNLRNLFSKVAAYNEVCCGNMKRIIMKIVLSRNDFLTKDIGRLRIFTVGSITIKDLQQKYFIGDTVYVKPVFNTYGEAKIVELQA